MSDRALLGVLAENIPEALISSALKSTNSQGERDRALPADLMMLYVVALSLYREVAYEEVLNCIMEGWRWLKFPRVSTATKSAINQARLRLGKDAVRVLFESLAKPISTKGTKGAYYRDWLTVALDGTTLTVPDSKPNAEAFGYASEPQFASYPLVRCECLCETGTHVPLAAAMGPYRTGEKELARRLLSKLQPGMLLLADREYLSYGFWEECLATGADLLWRVSASWSLKKHKELPDGSWLSAIRCKDGPDKGKERILRVIQYRVEGKDETYRVVTSILEPERAPALELASLYPERWEIEGVFDEMKTHLKGPRLLLRSKTPELVEQEFWGLMIAHRAIRTLMHEAALKHNKDPDELSFVSAVRIVKRTLPSRAAFSPSEALGVEAGDSR